ncbi:MAG: hypothetical protein IM600_17100 [Bacteroidetes bacterium]|nr:hypothetical protein [Bacteroidota bacterium]MCA6445149.1 hypothetical protein [Bacteroidota bacterium]
MSDLKEISLQASLLGEIVPFLNTAGMACLVTQQGMVDLTEQLVHYQEEGKSLYPKIYILDDLELIGKVLTPFEFYKIGEGDKSSTTMLKALKKCAPLTGDGWTIYLLRKQLTFEYGVFNSSTSILSETIEEILIDKGSSDLRCILIHQISDKIIEIKNFLAKSLIITFGGKFNSSSLSQFDDFIFTITKKVDPKIKDQIINFYKKVFYNVVQKGHGTLACVIDNKKKTLPKKLKDGIVLSNKIDVSSQILSKDRNIDLLSHVRLSASFSLITGMMLSDGITVFTNDGCVCAYNVFIKHSSKLNKTSTSGGARTRTYLGLCDLIGNGLEAAFIQSQDGKIEYKTNGK